MQSDMSYTYENLGFNPEEKKKIEKRMSKEFIDEYIKYIQARNEFNTTKHTKAELKQKVLDYAVYANVDPKDSEKLREKEDELKRESDKTDKDHELFYDNYSEKKGDFNAGREMQYVRMGKTTKIYSFPAKNTKKSNKRLIYGKMYRRNKFKKTYDNDIITSHAILSLLERQPKYYTNYVMSKIGGHLQDSDTWFEDEREKNIKKYDKTGLIKNRARLMVFHQPDTDEGSLENGNNNFHIIEGGKVKRISWIDIGGFLDVPDWPSRIPSIKDDEIAVYMQEFNKFLCVTPNLIELSVRQHLMAIGVKDEKILKEQTMKALNCYSIALKTFASYKDMINGRDSEFKNDLNYEVWCNGETYYSRLKRAINAAEEKDKKQFLEIVNDQSLQARLEKAINDFDNYKKKITEKTTTNEKEGNSISEQITLEGNVDPDKIKQDIINVIAKRLGKTKTLYWAREGKDGKLLNTRFFLKENAGYIREINNCYDKMCEQRKQNDIEALNNLLNLAKNAYSRPISACY